MDLGMLFISRDSSVGLKHSPLVVSSE
jgi:hypothetical protein